MSAITITITREEAKALILLSLIVLSVSGVTTLLAGVVSSWGFPYGFLAELAIFGLWIGLIIYGWDVCREWFKA